MLECFNNSTLSALCVSVGNKKSVLHHLMHGVTMKFMTVMLN